MTRRYDNLWEKFISPENFESAADLAIFGKKDQCAISSFVKNRESKLCALRTLLNDGMFRTSPYYAREIFRPKQRTIYVLPLYPDRIVQHALINILGPIWQSSFIYDSYACLRGRGLHAASRRVMHFIRGNKYVLHCDIRKFYPSINHKKLLEIISRKICDSRIMALLRDIVCSIGGETNVPIGNLTSQWFGNVYLNELDHYVQQDLHMPNYVRYCDDFLVFGNDKSVLQKIADRIHDFIHEKLDLEFSKCVIYPVSHGVDFIGYRHFRKYILLRRRTAKRVRKSIANIIKYGDTSPHARGVVAAAYGWARWANTYNFRRKLFRGVPRENRFRKIMNV